MNLLHIKLKNGEDLLAQEERSDEDIITIVAPISVMFTESKGVMGKGWCFLSATNVVQIKKSDIYFAYPASERGYEFYEDFMRGIFQKEEEFESEDTISELEDIFLSMIESKKSIKH